jgi:hypothetical protein
MFLFDDFSLRYFVVFLEGEKEKYCGYGCLVKITWTQYRVLPNEIILGMTYFAIDKLLHVCCF